MARAKLTRMIGGEKFTFRFPWRTKKAAKRYAKERRAQGWKVRIIKTPKSLPILGKWAWVTFERRR